jgi:RHS repeat-associated protein
VSRRGDLDTTIAYGYSYDAAGNLTGRTVVQAGDTTTWAYGWDALDRLVSVWREGVLIARYGYDVVGRRIANRIFSAASGGTVGYTRFVYAGDHVAYETDEAGTIGRTYLWGVGTDHLVGVREANGTQYVAVTDKLGSVRALVRRSDGVWTGSLRYDPYGALIDSAGSVLGLRYRWTGREWDAETGFYFHRARYYDPGAKRFVSEDPIGYAGGENLYAYAGGAVLETRDPSGLRRSPEYQDPNQWCSEPSCFPQSGWDGWIGAIGTILPTQVTYVTLDGRVIATIWAPIDVVRKVLDEYEAAKERFSENWASSLQSADKGSINGKQRLVAELLKDAAFPDIDQFTLLLAAVYRSGEWEGKVDARIKSGFLALGSIAPDWASQVIGKRTQGATFGQWTILRPEVFQLGQATYWALHETIHFHQPLWSESQVCFATNRYGMERPPCF